MIIFAKTRHHYDSYVDFWQLVDLSSFATCYVDEIDFSTDHTYIFTPVNGEVLPHLQSESLKKKRATVIWWYLERFDASTVPVTDVLTQMSPYVDRIWVSDLETCKAYPQLTYARFGSHPDLGNPPIVPPRFHFTHQSYAWGRRKNMYNKLKESGLLEGPSSWGDERNSILRASRVMVNLQQYPAPVNAPIRFALAAAYHLPTVSETITQPDLVEGIIPCVAYNDIPSAIRTMIDAPGDSGTRLFQKLCVEHTFRRCVEATL